MPNTQERLCKACGGTTHEIHVIDKAGYHPDTDLEYALPGDLPTFWTGKYPVAGKVLAFLCDGCGHITFFGKPEPRK